MTHDQLITAFVLREELFFNDIDILKIASGLAVNKAKFSEISRLLLALKKDVKYKLNGYYWDGNSYSLGEASPGNSFLGHKILAWVKEEGGNEIQVEIAKCGVYNHDSAFTEVAKVRLNYTFKLVDEIFLVLKKIESLDYTDLKNLLLNLEAKHIATIELKAAIEKIDQPGLWRDYALDTSK